MKTDLFRSKQAWRNYTKELRRKKRKQRILAGRQKRKHAVTAHDKALKKKFIGYTFDAPFKKTPEYDEVISFLISHYKGFSDLPITTDDGVLEVPKTFSITDTTSESMHFLKKLFHCLYTQSSENIFIDYKDCNYLDVDASACMDIILEGFIKYFKRCIERKKVVKIKSIVPINFEDKPDIAKVLFSIGAYKNIKKFKYKSSPTEDFIPFRLRIGDKQQDSRGIWKEIHETQIVDYVIDCLAESGEVLNEDAEKNISKVVGEVMANAEEHSNFRFRYAIGYFVKPNRINNELGVFKLSIFNFGQTIYESFSKPEKKSLPIVREMSRLSAKYTTDGLFRKAKFEEETLWTLYSLQEGVTSLQDWKRGKGTIRFIDRFFKIKGDDCSDNMSKLTLISGNTKIIFDGMYPLQDKPGAIGKNPIQVMTFNSSGNISELPDEKYVTFVPQTFPGTLITAKICITNKNIV